jgi:hypothetical protein
MSLVKQRSSSKVHVSVQILLKETMTCHHTEGKTHVDFVRGMFWASGSMCCSLLLPLAELLSPVLATRASLPTAVPHAVMRARRPHRAELQPSACARPNPAPACCLPRPPEALEPRRSASAHPPLRPADHASGGSRVACSLDLALGGELPG